MGVVIFDGVSIDKEKYTVMQAEKIIRKLKETDKDQEEVDSDDLIEDYEHN
jgi:hypothetical protein